MKHAKLFRPRTGFTVKCATCQKEVYVRPSALKGKNYCSPECHNKAQIKGTTLVCKVCGQDYYRPPSQVRGSKFCGNRCRFIYNRTLRAEKSPFWQGGKSSIYRRLRSSVEFAEWRKAIFERDHYICQDCGAHSGEGEAVLLHPHHIKSFTQFPELRFEVTNGITLCDKCHKRHTSWQNLNRKVKHANKN